MALLTLPNYLIENPARLDDLRRHYAEPHRRYHTWSHILALLEAYAEVKNQVSNREAFLLALYFHDAIYDPKASDNEEQSAQLLLSGAAADLICEVDCAQAAAIIRATRSHEPSGIAGSPARRDCELLLDIDLGILGAPPHAYRNYAHAIRQEYAHVPDEQFRIGRSHVLAAFLSRARIFLSDHFHDRLERQARINIADELEALAKENAL
jgi:predicted metal-dependent HD superfamily phosphohydrolase